MVIVRVCICVGVYPMKIFWAQNSYHAVSLLSSRSFWQMRESWGSGMGISKRQDWKLNSMLLLSLCCTELNHMAVPHSKKYRKWSLAMCSKKGRVHILKCYSHFYYKSWVQGVFPSQQQSGKCCSTDDGWCAMLFSKQFLGQALFWLYMESWASPLVLSSKQIWIFTSAFTSTSQSRLTSWWYSLQ